MDSLWTSDEIATATKGEATKPFACAGISIDTRELEPGDLFVPLKAERDGHDFIANAFRQGAAATLSEVPINGHAGVLVEDTLASLRAMATHRRDHSEAIRIGVTGSVGKTSLKEAIATVCEAAGPTHKSVKSFNNHWGVPLTLARMPRDTEFGVFEMGMNHAGELTDLSALVRPDIAVITKIAPAHLEHFDSVDAIARAKAEIFSGLAEGGRAVINLDCAYGPRLSRVAKKHGAKITTVGKSERADFRIGDVQTLADGSLFALHHDGDIHCVRVPIAGEHWVLNAALAIAVAYTAGVAVEDAAESITTLEAMKGRGARFHAELNGATLHVIDESYNANPESMRAAITAIGETEGRKIAVLGSMLELGEDADDLHAALSHTLVREGFERVVTVGKHTEALNAALPKKIAAAHVADADAAWDALLGEVRDGDTLLIKGSNGAGLGALVERLRGLGFSRPHRWNPKEEEPGRAVLHAL